MEIGLPFSGPRWRRTIIQSDIFNNPDRIVGNRDSLQASASLWEITITIDPGKAVHMNAVITLVDFLTIFPKADLGINVNASRLVEKVDRGDAEPLSNLVRLAGDS